MVFMVLYILSLPLILYYNFFSMRNMAEKSRLARRPSFFLLYFVFTYGSIAALWYSYDWKIALAALGLSWSINKISFRLYFRKYVYQSAQALVASDWFESGLSQDDRLHKAYEFAQTMALNNVAGK